MKKRLISLIAAIIFPVLSVAVASASELPTALGNGSFENTVITESDFGTGVHTNGAGAHGSGKWCLESSTAFEAWTNWKDAEDPQFYWKTTALQGYIELGVDDSLYPDRSSYVPDMDFYAREGTQFAELVANEKASLYQNIASTPGEIMSWGLSHRARTSNHPKDIMALFIGPMQSYSYTKATSGGNDIFIWMAQVIEDAGYFDDSDIGDVNTPVHECSERFTIYSRPDLDISEITDSNYNEYFSLTKTAEISEEWSCWIIQDTLEAWGDYAGTYEVPEGQTETTFAFTALTGYQNYDSYPNEGNLLDSFKFSFAYPIRIATTGGGSGTVTADDADADGNRVENVTVTAGSDHIGKYIAGTGISITAEAADENHRFLGAYVNDTFHEYSDTDYFTENNGVYTLAVTVENAEYIQLIFSRCATVIYDPNGGTYNGTSENTEITMSSRADDNTYSVWENNESAVSPDAGKVSFIGWYFARGGQKDDGTYTGALIESVHSVSYNDNSTTDTGDDTLDVSYTNTSGITNESSVAADYGVTFVAQWEYLQKVAAMTKQTNEATYKESNVGGSITMDISDSDNLSDSERTVETTTTSAQGYGRLKDTVTLTAQAASDSYVFMGWYDEDGNLLSHSATYSYAVSDSNTVYAHFSADVVYPYLSFISEKEVPDTADALFKKGSHVKVGEEYIWQSNQTIGGENIYGNTIATGFTLNTKGVSGYSYDHCQWTVTIPSGDTYVKIPDGVSAEDYPFTFESTPVLSDTEAQVNSGIIWKVSNVNAADAEGVSLSFVAGFDDITDDSSDEEISVFVVNGFDDISSDDAEEEAVLYEEADAVVVNELTGEVTMRLYDKLPTVITGESVITYGIVIDNIYAPQASAAFELKEAGVGADSEFLDISEDAAGEIVHETTAEGYRESEYNRYSEVTVEEAQ